jgi:hypothetical protein
MSLVSLVQVYVFRSPGSRGESRCKWVWVDGVKGDPHSIKVSDEDAYAFQFEGEAVRYYVPGVEPYDAAQLRAEPNSWSKYEFLLNSSATKLLARTPDGHWEAVPPQHEFLGERKPSQLHVRRSIPM